MLLAPHAWTVQCTDGSPRKILAAHVWAAGSITDNQRRKAVLFYVLLQYVVAARSRRLGRSLDLLLPNTQQESVIVIL